MAAPAPQWVDANTILIPATARGEDGLIGDGAYEITAEDPAFERWAQWLVVDGHPRPKPAG